MILYIYKDVISAFVQSIEIKAYCGIINLGTGNPISAERILAIIKNKINYKKNLKYKKYQIKRIIIFMQI